MLRLQRQVNNATLSMIFRGGSYREVPVSTQWPEKCQEATRLATIRGHVGRTPGRSLLDTQRILHEVEAEITKLQSVADVLRGLTSNGIV